MAKKSRKVKDGSEQHLPYGVGSIGQRVAPGSWPKPSGGRERYTTPSTIERILHKIRGGSDGVKNPNGGVDEN